MTDPLRDVLAAAFRDGLHLTDFDEPNPDEAADAIIAALAQQGVTLTREPGLDVLDAERLHDACVSLVGHAIGCPRGASEDRTQYTEDDPDWAAEVTR